MSKMLAAPVLSIVALFACLLAYGVQGQTSGSVRLVGEDGALSSSLTAGRLEVYYNGQWGTVCDDSFGSNDARVACRQLGFSGYINYGSVSSRFDAASSSTQTWLDDLSCTGSESSLGQCSHNGIGIENCGHIEDVYVSCLGVGALRLVSSFSTSSSAGRLEVYYNGEWGTVCDDSFGQTDANVACRQLGYESASNYGTVSALGYSQGSGRTWLDELQCTSFDIMLSLCTHNGYGVEDCSHFEDIAVSCSLTGQTTGSVRLVGEDGALSSSLTAGRLEVYYSGQWGTVCDDGFGTLDARVACRQLGFTDYITYGSVSTRFDAASSFTRTWLDNLSCLGSESSLGQCSHNGIGVENCDHIEDVYVSCLGDGALRLVGSFSTSSSAGRLEVYYSGQWGTVCDDSFGQTDANVACRQLGYESASNYGTISSLGYSQGSGRTWLDDLRCTSSDIMLSSCTHNGFGNEDCNHSEDIAVSCSSSSIIIPGRTSIRLVGENGALSPNLTAGRLEVYYNGQWGTVCDDSFGVNDARVACRQLGFSGYINYGSVSGSSSRFDAASSSTRTWLDDLSCTGFESSLGQCSHNGIGIEDCGHNEDVYVSCLGDGALRLVSSFSSSSSAGRLEVYYSGQWGTVCDDSFDLTDANVACRQLGYESASNYGTVFSLGYSQGTGRTWLDELGCISSDVMLSSCTHNGFGNEDCSHSEDVAISCSSSSINIPGFVSGGAIAGIVIGVLVPIVCIVVCVVIISVAVCSTTGRSTSGRSRRGNAQLLTTSAAATATIDTTTGTAAQAPPPPYSAQTYARQPQAAQYPLQGQAYPQAYPVQAVPYPPKVGGQGYPPPATEGYEYGYPQAALYPGAYPDSEIPAQPQPYPDQPSQDPWKVEMQPYPASDPANPPPAYPAGDAN